MNTSSSHLVTLPVRTHSFILPTKKLKVGRRNQVDRTGTDQICKESLYHAKIRDIQFGTLQINPDSEIKIPFVSFQSKSYQCVLNQNVNIWSQWEVVRAQLVEQSLPTPDSLWFESSHRQTFIYLLSTVLKRRK